MSIDRKIRKWLHDRSFYRKAEARRAEPVSLKRSLDLSGKRALICGVATDQSIAWSIAKLFNDQGCQIALAYQERVDQYVRELAIELNHPLLVQCELTSDEQIDALYEKLKQEWGSFDFLIHSVAFAKACHLQGKYYEIDRQGFAIAQEVSTFSLTALVRAGAGLMSDGGSVVTMTYFGSERAVPNYNIMGVCKAALESSVRYLAVDLGKRGIRVNAVSAGPIATLAASGITGFDSILDIVRKRAPLARNISAQDAADAALFLCSDLSRNITGEVLHVDAGYSITGVS